MLNVGVLAKLLGFQYVQQITSLAILVGENERLTVQYIFQAGCLVWQASEILPVIVVGSAMYLHTPCMLPVFIYRHSRAVGWHCICWHNRENHETATVVCVELQMASTVLSVQV